MKKVISSTLALILYLSVFLQVSITQQAIVKPTVYIDPKDNVFHISTTHVGDNFTISIKTVNWGEPGVFGYEFRLYYNNTLLEAVAAGIPEDGWLKPEQKLHLFVVENGTIHHSKGFVFFAATLVGPEQGKTGGGTIGRVTFKIIKAPVGEILSCILELRDVFFIDPDVLQYHQYNIINGNYLYSGLASPWRMMLRVDPKKTFTSIGETFTVNVSIADVWNEGVQNYEFKLYYNNSVLEAVKAWIPEGHFMTPIDSTKIFIVDPGTIHKEEGYVSFALTLLVPEPNKKGSGVLATITFNATALGSSILAIRDDIFFAGLCNQFRRSFDYDVIDGKVVVSDPDVNDDGIVNIFDLAMVGEAFGSYPGHPRWNPIADMDQDNVVNIIDAGIIAKNFGKTT